MALPNVPERVDELDRPQGCLYSLPAVWIGTVDRGEMPEPARPLAIVAADGARAVDAPHARPRTLRLGLPVAEGRGWVETEWTNEGPPIVLDRATLLVDPAAAAHHFRVYRHSDYELLANGGWDVARTRPIRIMPADATITTGERVLIKARVDWHEPVRMDVVLTWKGE